MTNKQNLDVAIMSALVAKHDAGFLNSEGKVYPKVEFKSIFPNNIFPKNFFPRNIFFNEHKNGLDNDTESDLDVGFAIDYFVNSGYSERLIDNVLQNVLQAKYERDHFTHFRSLIIPLISLSIN